MESLKEIGKAPAAGKRPELKPLGQRGSAKADENQIDVRDFLLLVTADKLLAYGQIIVV